MWDEFRTAWSTFLAIAFKEFIHFRRNKFIIRMAIVLQGTQVLLLGFIDLNAHDIPTVIVDQDRSGHSRELVEKLQATKTFEVKFITTSVAQARDHIRAGRAKVAIIIPPDFHRGRARRGTSRVEALVDGTDSMATGQALAAIDGMTAQITSVGSGEIEDVESSVKPHSILLFNPEGRTSHFTLPALLAVIMFGATVNLPGMALVREREQGTLERLLMTPVSFTGLMLGKVVPYFLFGVANAVVLLVSMAIFFDVPFRGSLFVLGAALTIYLLTTLAIGIYIAAAAAGTGEVMGRVGQATTFVLFLSGYIFPLSSLPKWLLPLAYALPVTHMVEIMRGITLRGASISDLWIHFAYLFIAPWFLLYGAVQKFKSTIHT